MQADRFCRVSHAPPRQPLLASRFREISASCLLLALLALATTWVSNSVPSAGQEASGFQVSPTALGESATRVWRLDNPVSGTKGKQQAGHRAYKARHDAGRKQPARLKARVTDLAELEGRTSRLAGFAGNAFEWGFKNPITNVTRVNCGDSVANGADEVGSHLPDFEELVTRFHGKPGDIYVVECPAHCGHYGAPVYGPGDGTKDASDCSGLRDGAPVAAFMDSSSICRAAIAMRQLGHQNSGLVAFRLVEPVPVYPGCANMPRYRLPENSPYREPFGEDRRVTRITSFDYIWHQWDHADRQDKIDRYGGPDECCMDTTDPQKTSRGCCAIQKYRQYWTGGLSGFWYGVRAFEILGGQANIGICASGVVDSYVEAPAAIAKLRSSVLSEWTVEAWIKDLGVHSNAGYLSAGTWREMEASDTGYAFRGIGLGLVHNRYCLTAATQDGPEHGVAVCAPEWMTSISKGNWTHMTGTFDGQEMKLYINGTLVESSGECRGNILWPEQETSLLMMATNSDLKGNGTLTIEETYGEIDEVRFWSKVLDEDHIARNIGLTLLKPYGQALVAYYRFDGQATPDNLIVVPERGGKPFAAMLKGDVEWCDSGAPVELLTAAVRGIRNPLDLEEKYKPSSEEQRSVIELLTEAGMGLTMEMAKLVNAGTGTRNDSLPVGPHGEEALGYQVDKEEAIENGTEWIQIEQEPFQIVEDETTGSIVEESAPEERMDVNGGEEIMDVDDSKSADEAEEEEVKATEDAFVKEEIEQAQAVAAGKEETAETDEGDSEPKGPQEEGDSEPKGPQEEGPQTEGSGAEEEGGARSVEPSQEERAGETQSQEPKQDENEERPTLDPQNEEKESQEPIAEESQPQESQPATGENQSPSTENIPKDLPVDMPDVEPLHKMNAGSDYKDEDSSWNGGRQNTGPWPNRNPMPPSGAWPTASAPGPDFFYNPQPNEVPKADPAQPAAEKTDVSQEPREGEPAAAIAHNNYQVVVEQPQFNLVTPLRSMGRAQNVGVLTKILGAGVVTLPVAGTAPGQRGVVTGNPSIVASPLVVPSVAYSSSTPPRVPIGHVVPGLPASVPLTSVPAVQINPPEPREPAFSTPVASQAAAVPVLGTAVIRGPVAVARALPAGVFQRSGVAGRPGGIALGSSVAPSLGSPMTDGHTPAVPSVAQVVVHGPSSVEIQPSGF